MECTQNRITGVKMKKLYTGLGDDGTTGLLGDARVSKSDLRLEAIGSLDELSAFLGLAKCKVKENDVKKVMDEIQRDLYSIMTEIAAVPQSADKFKPFSDQRVLFLEKWITTWADTIDIPHEFILPGETEPSAVFSICRTQTRKAERRMTEVLGLHKQKNNELLRYINRLSSLLFLLEIKCSQKGMKQILKFAKA